MVDIMGLEVTVAAVVVVMDTVVEEAVVVMDQELKTKVVHNVVEGTMAVVGTVLILETVVDNGNQVMGSWIRALLEDPQMIVCVVVSVWRMPRWSVWCCLWVCWR